MPRKSHETTAGASKRNGIGTKPQRERRNQGPVPPRAPLRSATSGPPRRGLKRPEFARNHSGSIEMQRNSRETTAGASKRNGIRAKPQRERRNQGPVPPRAVAVGNLSGPPRRGLKRPREAGIRAKPQREHRNATEFARNHSGSILNATEFARNHSGSVETKAPSHRPARRCGQQPLPLL